METTTITTTTTTTTTTTPKLTWKTGRQRAPGITPTARKPGQLFCTLGPAHTIQAFPRDGLCDYLFYDSLRAKNKKLESNADALKVFSKGSQGLEKTETGVALSWRWRGDSSKMAEETGIDFPGFPVRLLADAAWDADDALAALKKKEGKDTVSEWITMKIQHYGILDVVADARFTSDDVTKLFALLKYETLLFIKKFAFPRKRKLYISFTMAGRFYKAKEAYTASPLGTSCTSLPWEPPLDIKQMCKEAKFEASGAMDSRAQVMYVKEQNKGLIYTYDSQYTITTKICKSRKPMPAVDGFALFDLELDRDEVKCPRNTTGDFSTLQVIRNLANEFQGIRAGLETKTCKRVSSALY
ncbi:hypothetical protein HPB47_005614 [Ixodes persulcatus]|uniref:Uncharacterized protein n=1 Tax=Ixodes persulcatus TaxID=34615 RepID=A0AC60PDA9_IXOPE|nr:hypothetical protein HPB47_005614 [Ixodes persulcatus]